MGNQFVDYRVLAQVSKAAPKTSSLNLDCTRMLLSTLEEFSTLVHQRVGLDGSTYWEASIGSIAEALGNGFTPKRAGLLCHRIGLSVLHKKTCNFAVWNQEQLDILKKYFHVEEKP